MLQRASKVFTDRDITLIRKLSKADEERVADIWLSAGLEEYTYLPDFQALDFEQALSIFRKVIAADFDIWLEESEGNIRGYLAIKGGHIDRLYVDPTFQKLGVGEALVLHAKSISPKGLTLRTHQQNKRARIFYEKHGFVVEEYGVSPAPESIPDVVYRWQTG